MSAANPRLRLSKRQVDDMAEEVLGFIEARPSMDIDDDPTDDEICEWEFDLERVLSAVRKVSMGHAMRDLRNRTVAREAAST